MNNTIFGSRFDIIDPCSPFYPPPFYHHHDDLTFPTFSPLDFPYPASCCDVTTQFCTCSRRLCSPKLSLNDRVTSLESKLDRLLKVDRKYTWTEEIKGGGVDRKYKLKAEIEGDKYNVRKGVKRGETRYQWTAEIKGRDRNEKRIYTWGGAIDGERKKKGCCSTRMVEIEDQPVDYRVYLRQKKCSAKRAQTAKDKGKKKELSPHEAAVMIQMTYRTHLSHRSQTLADLRELAIARTKLRELTRLFHNYSYRSHISRDAEERQRFSEKIIVLLLTVDAIKGVDHMVKTAKRSMVYELEAMLERVDPQAGGRTTRRTFHNEIAEN